MPLELPPKRVRVLIVLVTLACCAFFLAEGSTQLVAAAWMPRRAALPKSELASTEPPAKGEQPPDWQAILPRLLQARAVECAIGAAAD